MTMTASWWHVNQAILLGRFLGPSIDFAPLLPEPVEDLQLVVESLNGGAITMQSEFCVAFCRDDMSYHLLYKTGLKDLALDMLCTQVRQEGVSQGTLPPETERILTDRSERSQCGESECSFIEAPTSDVSYKLLEAEAQIQRLTEELLEAKKQLQIATCKNCFLEMKLQEVQKNSSSSDLEMPPFHEERQTSSESATSFESTYTSTLEKQETWSLQRAIALGMLPSDSRLWSFATAIDPEEVDSLRGAVSLLNQGKLKCFTDFAIVFSQASFGYYLLYPAHRIHDALKMVAAEFVWLSSMCANPVGRSQTYQADGETTASLTRWSGD